MVSCLSLILPWSVMSQPMPSDTRLVPLDRVATEARLRSGAASLLVPRWKRALDICCIVLAAPVLLPLALLIAIGIKLLSRGPILFKQPRIGFLGKLFVCLKFR